MSEKIKKSHQNLGNLLMTFFPLNLDCYVQLTVVMVRPRTNVDQNQNVSSHIYGNGWFIVDNPKWMVSSEFLGHSDHPYINP